ncbi:ATP-binding protein [Ramlibacter sp. 2FC]|uniref:cache domain-containing sensor histidine kinase n=1 Tax=Ramlibacter sp. 2FC TaxID=2502188 RepID=UPI0010F7C1E8|nr:ATP-binding protein [Ramlibacter sp. 2FC]
MDDTAIDSEWDPARPATASPAAAGGWRQLVRSQGIDRVQVLVALAACLVSIAFCATLAYFVVASQRSVTERVRLQNQNLAHAFKLHATAAFDLVDHTLKTGRRQWLETGGLRDQWALGEAFPNFKKMIVQVAIIDAHGRLAASSIDPRVNPIYLGDREHFKVHLGSSEDRLFVGKPLIGRVSGRPSVQFSRPVFKDSGRFVGVVVASVDPGFIGDFFTGLRTDGGASYGLIGEDGVPRVWVGSQLISLQEVKRSPLLRVSGQGKLSGAFETPRSALQEGSSWHLESLDNAPLIVAVSTDSAVLLGQLRALHLAAWVLGGLFVAFTAAAAFHMLRGLRRNNDIAQQLHESQRRASSANEMKSRFLASVSHELRTPLNGILGFSELVAMSTDAAQAANYGQLIHKSARHLHELVNTMLDLAKIEAGRMEVTRSPCDPWDLCEAVAGMHRQAAEKKGLAFRVDYAPDLPAEIHTDRIKLMHILSNLLHNAVKFTLEGRVGLEVGLQDEGWLFRVVDTGVGMTPEQMAGLFDRFRHSEFHMVAVAWEQGSGLGMALCKELVELLGGRIAVRSVPAQGTTVEVFLPVR